MRKVATSIKRFFSLAKYGYNKPPVCSSQQEEGMSYMLSGLYYGPEMENNRFSKEKFPPAVPHSDLESVWRELRTLFSYLSFTWWFPNALFNCCWHPAGIYGDVFQMWQSLDARQRGGIGCHRSHDALMEKSVWVRPQHCTFLPPRLHCCMCGSVKVSHMDVQLNRDFAQEELWLWQSLLIATEISLWVKGVTYI